MADATTGTNPPGVVLYDESGNRVTLVGGAPTAGQVPVKFHSTFTTTGTVTASTTATTLLVSNTSRKGAAFYNEAGQTAYVVLGGTASVTNYTVQVAVGAYYEVPYGYTGSLSVITASATATLRYTEFT